MKKWYFFTLIFISHYCLHAQRTNNFGVQVGYLMCSPASQWLGADNIEKTGSYNHNIKLGIDVFYERENKWALILRYRHLSQYASFGTGINSPTEPVLTNRNGQFFDLNAGYNLSQLWKQNNSSCWLKGFDVWAYAGPSLVLNAYSNVAYTGYGDDLSVGGTQYKRAIRPSAALLVKKSFFANTIFIQGDVSYHYVDKYIKPFIVNLGLGVQLGK